MASTKVKDPFLPIIAIIIVAAIAGGYYYWIQNQRQAAPPQKPPAAEAQPGPEAEPAVRHPIESVEAPKPQTEPQPLPPLRESDAPLRAAAADLVGGETLERLFNLTGLVRRFVVTVEELPRKKMGQRYSVAKPVSGRFRVSGKDDTLAVDPANYRRYAPYVALAEAVDVEKLVAVYVHFYPLFQQEYKSLGYPKRYFNDRLVETIDDLLAAPDVKGPIRLTQPAVMYQFADPALERLSAGQKIMIRMGPKNAARVKAKLREIRARVASVPK